MAFWLSKNMRMIPYWLMPVFNLVKRSTRGFLVGVADIRWIDWLRLANASSRVHTAMLLVECRVYASARLLLQSLLLGNGWRLAAVFQYFIRFLDEGTLRHLLYQHRWYALAIRWHLLPLECTHYHRDNTPHYHLLTRVLCCSHWQNGNALALLNNTPISAFENDEGNQDYEKWHHLRIETEEKYFDQLFAESSHRNSSHFCVIDLKFLLNRFQDWVISTQWTN